ncbi:MAG: hypothetical protein MJZ52_04270 [Bacteroidales bacterium]|nr:hypothetical protein [Bacteroidales bacterium]
MRKQRFKGNKACFASPWDEIYKNIHEVVEASKSQKDHFERNLAALYEMREQMKETDRMIKATGEQMKETDRKMKQLEDLFTTQWGKLVEALEKPACLKLFSDLGIGITQVYNGPRKGKYFCNDMEIDVILCNTTVAVAVEVKTTCKIEHIDHFLQQMEHFKETFHPFANYTVYPAVVALKYDEGSDVYASKKGLFVLHANGEDMFDLVEPKVRKEY